jgi:pimeloyl-ACP methyl ester carboxylesterase
MGPGFAVTRDAALPPYAERFAERGFAALVFDYRYFGDSGGQPRQLINIRRQHEDYLSALSFVATLEGIDPRRLALWGASFSGGHVVELAARGARVAAIVSQCPDADEFAALRELQVIQAGRLIAAGLRDWAGSLVGRDPHCVPAVGPPGSVALMTTPDSEPGYRALVPPASPWRNEFAARATLTMGFFRPVRHAHKVPCPLLVCICDRDAITPPKPAARMAELAPFGEARHYDCGHFDIYRGEWFEQTVRDQIEFLTAHLLDRQDLAA